MNTIILIIGNLSIFKCPEFEIVFNNDSNKKYKAIIDTGSYDSHIRQDVLQDLKITNANGQSIGDHPEIGIVQVPNFGLKFKFDGYELELNETFNLMATHYQYPVIIGSKFLAKCKEFHYYGEENRFELIV